MAGDDGSNEKVFTQASLKPPKEAHEMVSNDIEELVWKLDPRAPINTIDGENPYLCMQKGLRDRQKLVGLFDMDSGQMVVGRGDGVDWGKTTMLLEKQDHAFNFEIKSIEDYWLLELGIDGEARDWLEDKAIKKAVGKLQEVLMVIGRDRKVGVKTKEGKQLVTMAEYLVPEDNLMVGSRTIFENGLFKGYFISDGGMVVGARSGTHDDIRERYPEMFGHEPVGIFTGHGDMLTIEIVEEPVAVWGPGVASRLMRLGMDENTIIRVEGTLGNCGIVSCEKSLTELSEGIDITKIKVFAPILFGQTKHDGKTVGVGVGSYLSGKKGDWLVVGSDSYLRELILVNDSGEKMGVGYDQMVGQLRDGSWDFIGLQKPFKVFEDLTKDQFGKELVGVVANNGKVYWSNEAYDHESLGRRVLLPKSEIIGLAQYQRLEDGKNHWLVTGSKEAVEKTLVPVSKLVAKSPNYGKDKILVKVDEPNFPEFGEMEVSVFLGLWNRFH